MSEKKDQKGKSVLSLSGRGKLELKGKVDGSQVRQSFLHGRSKTVTVEVKKRRVRAEGIGDPKAIERAKTQNAKPSGTRGGLTQSERDVRVRALQQAKIDDVDREKQEALLRAEREQQARQAALEATEQAKRDLAEAERLAEEQTEQKAKGEQKSAEEKPVSPRAKESSPVSRPAQPVSSPRSEEAKPKKPVFGKDKEKAGSSSHGARVSSKKDLTESKKQVVEPKRFKSRLTLQDALSGGGGERQRSMAALKRARERERRKAMDASGAFEKKKVVREVIIPETITVAELSNRMAVRSVDVIKSLMKMGVIAATNHAVDADTAELVVAEFGHTSRRVSDSDVETQMMDMQDAPESLQPRAPVITVMGHVDHGKTSLLDALRQTDVVAGESGGITQHIGAYQVKMPSGVEMTFIDTPGHEAFSSMRARGANVTDIVILVVAADDGIKDQTIEAIRHARAAKVPIIVAINKMDKPGADPERVKLELLQQELVVESMSGDVLCVEISAKKKTNLDQLAEAIQLQSELLDLKANSDCPARGVIVEAKLDKSRGPVATVLIQRGTIKVGDVFASGSEWGKVRALINDRGQSIKEAGPSDPVEILGFNGAPHAGDDFGVVDDEAKARSISEYRLQKRKDKNAVVRSRGSLEQMLSSISSGELKDLNVLIKSDVQGSLEAITASLLKLESGEVKVRVLHSAVGAISESDVALAMASNAWIIGFNVRASTQARDMAQHEGIDIRYYSVIYEVIDDVKTAVKGLEAPKIREKYLGNAEVREVFNITKVGKIAGCMVTTGEVKRGAKIRLLRDNVVIHDGALKSLKRFKEEVKDLKEGYECGIALENYNDLKVGDVFECYVLEEFKD